MLRFLINLFPSAPVSEAKRKKRRESSVNNLVTKYASGNIRLQQGQYLTKEAALKLKQRALRHRFSE